MNSRSGDVYTKKQDGSYEHIGHMSGGKFVADGPFDPKNLKPIDPKVQLGIGIPLPPEQAKDLFVDSTTGDVYKKGADGQYQHVGHLNAGHPAQPAFKDNVVLAMDPTYE